MPDIPGSDGREGLIALGQGLMKAGAAVANLQNQFQPDLALAKADYDTQATTEYLQFRQWLDNEVSIFGANIPNDPEHDKYAEKWQALQETITAKMNETGVLKTSKGRLMVNEYYTGLLTKETPKVYEAMSAGVKRDGVNAFSIILEEQVNAGDVTGVKDTIQKAFEGHIIGDTASFDKYIPVAEYNNALNMMSTWDRKSQLDILNAGNAEKILGLDTQQVQNLREALDKKYSSQVSYAATQKVASQTEIGSKLLGMITADPTKDVDYKIVADAYSQLIGSPYESIARNELDRQNKKREDINKANIEEGMSVNYTNYSGQLLNWKWNFGTGDAPVSLDELVSARNSPDPASKITVPEYDKLVTLFDSIVAFKNSAEGKTDQVAANELWDYAIGDHPGWSAEERARKMAATGYMGTKVDGGTYNTILNAANSDISLHEDWDSYLKQVTASFDAQLSALAADQKTGAVLQDLAYKRGIAYRTMLNVLRTYTDGDKTGLWQKKVDEFKTKNIVDTANSSVAAALTSPSGVTPVVARTVEQIARAVLGWAFPRATAGLGASSEMQLEWARQQNPEKFVLEPDAYSTWKNELPRIQEQMRNLLSLKTSRAIAKNATIASNTGDDTVFVNGNTYYQFRSEVVGTDVRNVLYENTVDDKGNWSGWKAK